MQAPSVQPRRLPPLPPHTLRGALPVVVQVVLPYLNLALDMWSSEARGVARGATARADSSSDDGSGSDSEGDDDEEDARGAAGRSGTSAAWRAEMAAQRKASGGKGSTSSPASTADYARDAEFPADALPDTPRPKMIADCLAVLVVATFKINVRPVLPGAV